MPDTLLTHDGDFHADDVFGIAVLLTLYPSAAVIRTRDEPALKRAVSDRETVVVDVGAVFDPALNAFDHHQLTFTEARPCGTAYAAFGLIWRAYGEAYLRAYGVEDELLPGVLRYVDDRLVRGIDAVDNGAIHWDALPVGSTERLSPTTVSQLVADFAPSPLEVAHREDWRRGFDAAVTWSRATLARVVARGVAYERGGRLIESADDGSSVLLLDRAVPWRGRTAPHHLCVVFPAPDGTWFVQAVPPEHDPVAQKRPLPAAWAGLRHEALQRVSGVEEAIFCHRARFIAGARSRRGALALAARWLATEQ